MDGKAGDGDAIGRNTITGDVNFGFFHGDEVVDVFGGEMPEAMRMNVGNIEKDGFVREGFGGE